MSCARAMKPVDPMQTSAMARIGDERNNSGRTESVWVVLKLCILDDTDPNDRSVHRSEHRLSSIPAEVVVPTAVQHFSPSCPLWQAPYRGGVANH